MKRRTYKLFSLGIIYITNRKFTVSSLKVAFVVEMN